MATPPGLFDYERHALRWILKRLMGENHDLETLCKHVPKIANSVANITRVEAAVTSGKPSQEMDAVRKALSDLIDDRRSNKEDAPW